MAGRKVRAKRGLVGNIGSVTRRTDDDFLKGVPLIEGVDGVHGLREFSVMRVQEILAKFVGESRLKVR
jgi:hypothetical protein